MVKKDSIIDAIERTWALHKDLTEEAVSQADPKSKMAQLWKGTGGRKPLTIPHEFFYNVCESDPFKATSMSCWYGWNKVKTVFKISPTLWDTMMSIPFPDRFPSESLKLPNDFTVFDTPTGVYAMFFDRLMKSVPGEGVELRVNLLVPDYGWMCLIAPHLVTGTTIKDAIDSFYAVIEERMGADLREDKSFADGIKPIKESLKGLINTLFYVSGHEDFILRERPKLSKKLRQRGVSPGKVIEVGRKFDFVIRGLRLLEPDGTEAEETETTPTGRKNKPHVRRQHVQTYWTGEGRTTPVIRVKAQIATGGFTVDEIYQKMINEKGHIQGLIQ